MKKTLDVVKIENGNCIDVEPDLIYFEGINAERSDYEIVDDYLDAQEWVESYDIIEDEDRFIIKVNDDEYYNYVATVKQLRPYDDWPVFNGTYYDYDALFDFYFKVDEEHEWTYQRENAMIELLDSMTDEEVEDVMYYFENHVDYEGDNYSEARNLLYYHLVYKYDLANWNEYLKFKGREEEIQ